MTYSPLCAGNPGPNKLFGTLKVAQLTGDIDRETCQKTLNETGTRFGIYGTPDKIGDISTGFNGISIQFDITSRLGHLQTAIVRKCGSRDVGENKFKITLY